MKRLTTDNPKNNHETLMNYCTADKDGWAVLKYAGGEENIKLHEYAAKCCREHGCKNRTADFVADDGLFDCYDCPVAIMYYCGSQAAENNAQLSAYEDTGFAHKQITKMQAENYKLRELLKSAVESMKDMADNVREVHGDDCVCGSCEYDCDTTVGESGEPYGECPGFDNCYCFRWKHADEAEEVLKETLDNIPAADVQRSGMENGQERYVQTAAEVHQIITTATIAPSAGLKWTVKYNEISTNIYKAQMV